MGIPALGERPGSSHARGRAGGGRTVKCANSLPALLVGLGLLFAPGCKSPKPGRVANASPTESENTPPPPVVHLDFVDSDGFDLLFESALVNRQPAIDVKTNFATPEWGTRLNHWIAAWNAGHRHTGFRARGQLPVTPSVVVDGDSIREFRLLVDDLMGRVEDSARLGGRWWAEKHMRERRIALLKPYNLRFHMDAEQHIHLIFCHSDYAEHHKAIVRSIANPVGDESLDWFPGYCCSHSRQVGRAESSRPDAEQK